MINLCDDVDDCLRKTGSREQSVVSHPRGQTMRILNFAIDQLSRFMGRPPCATPNFSTPDLDIPPVRLTLHRAPL